MLGLEYALALAFTELVDGGTGMTEADVLARLSWQPAAIAGMGDHGGPIVEGRPANLCVIDPDGTLDHRRQRRGLAESQRALRGTRGAGPGPPHVLLRGTRRDRRRGPAMSGEHDSHRRGRDRAGRRHVFEGEAIGAEADGGVSTGEFVFNTVLSGYQEVISDPSYAGQVITFTYPHIGNYGVNSTDDESAAPDVLRAWWSATWHAAHSNHRCRGRPRRLPDPSRHRRSRRDRHPSSDPPPPRPRRPARGVRDRGRVRARGGGTRATGTDGRDLVEVGHAPPTSRPSVA